MNGEHDTWIAMLMTKGWIRTVTVGAGVLLAAGALPAAAGRAAAVQVAAAAPGTISTFAGGPGGPARADAVSLAIPGNGNANTGASACGLVAAADGIDVADGTTVRRVLRPGDGLTTLLGAGSGYPQGGPLSGGPAAITTSYGACGVAQDHAGNQVIADSTLDVVRVLAAHSGTFYGQAMTAGDVYTVAGTGQRGLGGSGVPATQTNLAGPWGVAVDAHGNLVIADFGTRGRTQTFGAEIRVVAASTGRFYGIGMAAGDIYTVAGHRVGGAGYTGDGGPATRAGLGEFAGSVAIDKAGNLVLADTSDNAIRLVAVKTGSFYGQAMTAGHIYTVAGNGGLGFSGDGRRGTQAQLEQPEGVAVTGAGGLLIADSTNNRIRMLTG
jgi:hypothetical protein